MGIGLIKSNVEFGQLNNLTTNLNTVAWNLGGGISCGDALEEFKRGFANREQPWLTSELICDREKYDALSAGKSAGAYFPVYRA